MAGAIDDGDVSLNKLKQSLLNEFERIKNKLDHILDQPVKTSATLVADGVTKISVAAEYYRQMEAASDEAQKESLRARAERMLEQADDDFHVAHDKAVDGFGQSTTFERKVLAIKLRIVTILHRNGYFNEKERDMLVIEPLILHVWSDFLGLAEVRSAVRDEFAEGVMTEVFRMVGDSKARNAAIYNLSVIKGAIAEILQYQPPVKTVDGEKKELYNLRPTILKSHTAGVTCVAASGGLLYSASEDSTLKVWDVSSEVLASSPIATYQEHKGEIMSMCLCGSRLYTGSKDNSIIVWDISNPEVPAVKIGSFVKHEDYIDALAVVPDKRLFSGSGDMKIIAWDMNNGSLDYEKNQILDGSTSGITALAVYKSERLFAGAWDKIYAWDISSDAIQAEPSATFIGQFRGVMALCVTGDRLISGHGDNTIKIWSVLADSNTPLATLSSRGGFVAALTVSGGMLFSAAGVDIRVWDIRSDPIPPHPLAELEGHKDMVLSLTVAEGRLYSGAGDNTIHVRYV